MASKFVSGLTTKVTEFSSRLRRNGVKVKKEPMRVRVASAVKAVSLDYKYVIDDTLKNSKESPLKASLWLSVVAVLFAAGASNPSEEEYFAALNGFTVDMCLVGESCRKRSAHNYLMYLRNLRSQGRLRSLNLYLLTIFWEDSDSVLCCLPHTSSSELQTSYLSRIIDVGIFTKFYRLNNIMTDFDIEPSLFTVDSVLTRRETINPVDVLKIIGTSLVSRVNALIA